MLEFFRKYQRYFFVFISIVIIASFSFFGTFSTVSSEGEKREDRLLVHAVDGSDLMLSQVQALSRFIASDGEDFDRAGSIPNLCNNGVIRYDLLRSGLADLLAASYFGSLKEEFASRLDRAKRFRPYVHAEIPFLSAEGVWERFLPAMNKELHTLKQETEVSPATFSHLSRLYQQQSYLTPESLRRVLFFQQRQFGGKVDPRLQYEDLSLFGFHSVSDWFSRDFIDLVSQFILNAAQVAKAKGFSVTIEEAKGDLLCNFQTAVQKQGLAKSNPQLSFAQHLRSLGFDERSAAEVWQKVLLFRRYFQGVAQAAFVDRLPYRDFASYARETALISLYQWPAALRLKNLQDLIEFQTYLLAVSPRLKNPLALPSEFYAIEEIRERHPELVQVHFRAKIAEIPLAEIGLRAAVKEVWEWQCEEQNWKEMRNVFSFLPIAAAREERFRSLEKLSASQRSQVDALARLRLLDRHPEWIEEAWAAAPVQDQTIRLSSKSVSLPHIEKTKEFSELLAKAADGQEEAKSALLRYFGDAWTLYRIEGVSCSMPEHVLTFEEAKQQDILVGIADRYLQDQYLRVRDKSPAPFKTPEGGWKTYAEAKAQIAKLAFSEVFKSIESQNEKSASAQTWTDDLYAAHRMLPVSKLAFDALQNDPLDSHWIRGQKTDLREQFQLVRKEQPIHRTDKEKWMKEKAFLMLPNEWSPIHVPPDGDISFFYLIEKKPSDAPIFDQIAFGKELIAGDAQRYLAEKLLETTLKKHSIVLPLQSEP